MRENERKKEKKGGEWAGQRGEGETCGGNGWGSWEARVSKKKIWPYNFFFFFNWLRRYRYIAKDKKNMRSSI